MVANVSVKGVSELWVPAIYLYGLSGPAKATFTNMVEYVGG
jgi:hypothetical protein